MYLAIHATAGLLIGRLIDQPAVAAAVGVASHFLLDAIPHSDGDLPPTSQTARQLFYEHFQGVAGLLYIEGSLGVIVVWALLSNPTFTISQSMVWGSIGAMAPDLLQLLRTFIPHNRLLNTFQSLHDRLHYHPHRPLSWIDGHLIQLITLTSLLLPLL